MVWVFQCLQKGLVSPGKQSTIMQNRENKNPVSQLAKIAEAIGCSLQELMGIHEGNQGGSSYGIIRCPNCGSEIKLNPEL